MVKIYECKKCLFSTEIKTHFTRHLKTKKHLRKMDDNNEDQASDDHIKVSNVKVFRCKKCLKNFSSKSNLNKHIKKNTCNGVNDNPLMKYLKDHKTILNHFESNVNHLNHQESHLNPQESILNPQESILNHEESILNHTESNLNDFESYLNYSKTDNKNKDYRCFYCQKVFTTSSNMHRHMRKCRFKKQIEGSGLYIMWNHKMVDKNGNMYYKLGRTSSRKVRIQSYASEYKLKVSDIKFLYEVEVNNEKLAEKIVFNILEDYRIDNIRELFLVPFDIAKRALDEVSYIIMNYKYEKLPDLTQDNIDILMDHEELESDDPDFEDEEFIKEYDKFLYLKNIINGDYDVIKEAKDKKKILQKREHRCEYCNKNFSKNSNMHRHMRKCKFKNNTELTTIKVGDKTIEEKIIEKMEKLFDRKIEKMVEEGKLCSTTNNNTYNDNKIIQQINLIYSMKPVELLNKYCSNNPSCEDVFEYLEIRGLNVDEQNKLLIANNAKNIDFVASEIDNILKKCNRELISNSNEKQNTCENVLFSNDGSCRRHISKGKNNWLYINNEKKLDWAVSKILDSVSLRYEIQMNYIKKTRAQIIKKIKKMNDWGSFQDKIINKIATNMPISIEDKKEERKLICNKPKINEMNSIVKNFPNNDAKYFIFSDSEDDENIIDDRGKNGLNDDSSYLVYTDNSSNESDEENIKSENNEIKYNHNENYEIMIDCGREYLFHLENLNAFDKNTLEYVGKVIHEDECPLHHDSNKLNPTCWKYIDYKCKKNKN